MYRNRVTTDDTLILLDRLMKKILFFGMATVLMATMLTGCQKVNSNECRIHGTISEQYNDKRIFLVPLMGPQTAQFVDSIEVKNGHFEFVTDTVMMAKILVDYHYRMGAEPLLVVTEPGDVQVTIGDVSDAAGTPQNDSLSKWKLATQRHNFDRAALRRDGKAREADSLHLAYKHLTRRMAASMQGTVLGDWLAARYPLTYKRQYPDGRVVTINADTNEEVAE